MRHTAGRCNAAGCWLVAMAAVVAGCGPSGSGVAPESAVTVVSRGDVGDQITAVRVGDANRIVSAAPLTDAEWESLRGLTGLRELVLEHGSADDGRAEILATLTGLERLVLRESPLTDAGFRRLAECHTLRDLNVPQAACTAAGVRALASLAVLRSLRLGGPQLAGVEVCEAVASLPQLRSLHLIDVPIGDDGLAALQRLPGLWNLYLDGAGVSDEAWERYFQSCPRVHVHVDQAHHDRDPRGHLHEQAP
jgi:hypothetical protein